MHIYFENTDRNDVPSVISYCSLLFPSNVLLVVPHTKISKQSPKKTQEIGGEMLLCRVCIDSTGSGFPHATMALLKWFGTLKDDWNIYLHKKEGHFISIIIHNLCIFIYYNYLMDYSYLPSSWWLA